MLAQRDMGMQADGESDELKRVLLEGNPIFLAITFAVSMLHSVFDVLAFKNDIGFWRNKKSVEGLSVRTVGINCFCQVSFAFILHPQAHLPAAVHALADGACLLMVVHPMYVESTIKQALGFIQSLCMLKN